MSSPALRFQADREAFLLRLIALAEADSRIQALWLEGSLADGTEDALSDVDARLAIDDAAFDEVWQQRRDLVARLGEVLLAVDAYIPGLQSIECILAGPVKLDLIFEHAAGVAAAPRSAVRLLVDKAALGPTLQAGVPQPVRSAVQRMAVIVGIARQGGLWPVRLLLRGQWATFAMAELELINDNLAMVIAVQLDPQLLFKNRLSMPRLLPAARRQELEDLSAAVIAGLAQRDLQALQAAHLRIHDSFVRESRAAFARFGVPYPVGEAGDAALRAFYEQEWPATLPA